jgi:hypothetical protein
VTSSATRLRAAASVGRHGSAPSPLPAACPEYARDEPGGCHNQGAGCPFWNRSSSRRQAVPPVLPSRYRFRCRAAGSANPVVVTAKGSGARGCDNHGVRRELPAGRGLPSGLLYRGIPDISGPTAGCRRTVDYRSLPQHAAHSVYFGTLTGARGCDNHGVGGAPATGRSSAAVCPPLRAAA